MKNTLNIYKPLGKTPFEVVEKVKKIYPEFSDKKIGYAGRLDPMAEGVLLLLVDNLNKDKKSFENLDKEYTFEAIIGIQTDTYDLLGIPQLQSTKNSDSNYQDKVTAILNSFKGDIQQSYPPYSSARVNGKPLFYWARENKLNSITIPQKKVSIFTIADLKFSFVNSEHLHRKIVSRINSVKGNFRQESISKAWIQFFEKNKNVDFSVIKASINCSSGTYVRSLVHDLGIQLGTGAVTYSILRTRVGSYTIENSEKIFEK